MEKASKLEVRARQIIARAHEALSLPDSIYLSQRYISTFGEGFSLEIRSTSDTRVHEFLDGNSRYIYLNTAEAAPAFSLDLNDLTYKGVVEGHISHAPYLPKILEQIPPDLELERALVSEIVTIMKQHDVGIFPNAASVEKIELTFRKLLDMGAVATTREVARTHSDGTVVSAISVDLEGPIEFVWDIDRQQPRVKITFGREPERTHTVLEETCDGRVEAYIEIADELERIASFIDEKDITRDDEGNIIAVSCTFDQELALVAAERSAGLHELHSEQLAFIERYFCETFRPRD